MHTLYSIARYFIANPFLRLALGMSCALGILLVACAIDPANPGLGPGSGPLTIATASVTPEDPNTPTPSIAPTDIPGILPDLVVNDFWLYPKQDTCFDPVVNPLGARLIVHNTGSADAGPFYVDINGTRLFVSAGLAAGQTVRLWAPVAYPSNSALVDSTGQVVERNESNNQVTKTFPIATAPPTCTEVPQPLPTNTPTFTPTHASSPAATSVQALGSNVRIGERSSGFAVPFAAATPEPVEGPGRPGS